MKRTFRGFLARLSPEGRVLEVATPGIWKAAGVTEGDQLVPCAVVLSAWKKPSRLGKAAQKRRASGGPRVIGRPSVSVVEWQALKDRLHARSVGACEVPGCTRWAADPHHVIKASQGGPDALWNLVALCRRHHDETDVAEQSGRLVIRGTGVHLGYYGFGFWRTNPVAELGYLVFRERDDGHDAENARAFWKVYGPTHG